MFPLCMPGSRQLLHLLVVNSWKTVEDIDGVMTYCFHLGSMAYGTSPWCAVSAFWSFLGALFPPLWSFLGVLFSPFRRILVCCSCSLLCAPFLVCCSRLSWCAVSAFWSFLGVLFPPLWFCFLLSGPFFVCCSCLFVVSWCAVLSFLVLSFRVYQRRKNQKSNNRQKEKQYIEKEHSKSEKKQEQCIKDELQREQHTKKVQATQCNRGTDKNRHTET